ncbi:D-alanine--D-alanine ligase A, partial [Acinetobacter baumannii]|nr:D-alanine--D-alanine ligase A [Acinetobacter baumannii]
AKTVEELKDGIEKAFKEDKKIVLEEFVDGYEVECAVLGNEAPITAEVGQINSCKEFYDYEAKYINPASELIIPANISEEKRNE